MKKLIKSSSPGFTLVECAITLIIFVALVTFSLVKLDGYQDKLVLDNTTREIKTDFEQAMRVSTIKDKAVVVTYFPKSKKLIFSGSAYNNVLKLDSRIQVYGITNLNISSSGIISPLTITVAGQKSVQKIKIQMAWGRAIVDQE